VTDAPREAVTTLLLQWRQGNKAALDRLLPIVYDELRRVARARLKNERAGHALQTTVLVHEAYLRLVDLDRMTVHDRAHFFALSSRLMRQILVDHARRVQADKRGGAATIIALDDAADPGGKPPNLDVLALDEALEQLAAIDARLCRVVELKFFAGFNIDETAAALEVSAATVERDWAFARAWLFQRLSPHTS
jgi:RNA polymerase sigma factor (TIGR02999 family)